MNLPWILEVTSSSSSGYLDDFWLTIDKDIARYEAAEADNQVGGIMMLFKAESYQSITIHHKEPYNNSTQSFSVSLL